MEYNLAQLDHKEEFQRFFVASLPHDYILSYCGGMLKVKSRLRLEHRANRFLISEVNPIDGQILAELNTPDARTVHIVVDDIEDWGIVHENLPDHIWEILTLAGNQLRFADMPVGEIEGEFLKSPWCCPDCRLILKPSGAIEVLDGARLERYHCVNPTCSSQQQSVDFTPDIGGPKNYWVAGS